MKHTSNATGFRLSRIYAQGWNASRQLDGADQTNPYPAEPERGRWQAGFANAQISPVTKTR
jgi:hypothetical protein